MSTQDPRFDWRKVEWKPSMGRGGYVPRRVYRLPPRVKSLMCRLLGHPVEALEPITCHVRRGKDVPGHMCGRCYGPVKGLDRLFKPGAA
jgi:hypothetical protein